MPIAPRPPVRRKINRIEPILGEIHPIMMPALGAFSVDNSWIVHNGMVPIVNAEDWTALSPACSEDP
jgi:hypothetical protein